MDELQEMLASMFRDWGSGMFAAERRELEAKARRYSYPEWEREHLLAVSVSGVAAGLTGGWWSVAAVGADLLWCRQVAPQACLGVGYILDREVDFLSDMNHILAIWADVASATNSPPEGKVYDEDSGKTYRKLSLAPGGAISGKVGVKSSPKVVLKLGTKGIPKFAGKIAGQVASNVTCVALKKTALKSGSKVAGKIASKVVGTGVQKVTTKVAAKIGVGWIPIIGGAVSGGINYWLLSGLIYSAYKYYSHSYVIYGEAALSDE